MVGRSFRFSFCACVMENNAVFEQNMVVMRHGDRIDHDQPLWRERANRPWDPPLIQFGKNRAWSTGKTLRTIGFPIHRVIVSPFHRCLQTAFEVISALCASDDQSLVGVENSQDVVIDPTIVKVYSIPNL